MLNITAYTYPHQIPRDSPWFKVESFESKTHRHCYFWFGRFCVYVRTARP